MSDGKKEKSAGEVIRVYVAYWMVFGFLAGSLACTDLVGALAFYLSLPVSMTFLFVYVCKDRIKASPLRFMSAFLLLMALMLVPFKAVLDFYFSYVCIAAVCGIGVVFAYTYLVRERIFRSPWRYLFPLVFLLLVMSAAMIALPTPDSFVPANG